MTLATIRLNAVYPLDIAHSGLLMDCITKEWHCRQTGIFGFNGQLIWINILDRSVYGVKPHYIQVYKVLDVKLSETLHRMLKTILSYSISHSST